MITLENPNSLKVTLSGFTERSTVIEPAGSTLSMQLVPFMRGADATWVTLTQAQYDALPEIDPEIFYLIVE